MKLDWRPDRRTYVTGHVAYLGAWPVGKAVLRRDLQQQDSPAWTAHCSLPGPNLERVENSTFHTPEEAQRWVEQRVELWVAQAGLKRIG